MKFHYQLKFLFKKLFLFSYFLLSTFTVPVISKNLILIWKFIFLVFHSIVLKDKRESHWIPMRMEKFVDWHWFWTQEISVLVSTCSIRQEFNGGYFEPQYYFFFLNQSRKIKNINPVLFWVPEPFFWVFLAW